jgi:FlaA1/EpsC-like NDP-sugar epimerase
MAKRMIRLSGLDVQDDNNPHGDIRVEFTGLRPGEKLYEELLISDNPEATAHERIFKAHEHAEPWDEMHQALTRLELACQHNDLRQVYALLKQYVHGFNRPGHAVIESLPAPKSKKVTALRSAA